ncbi:MAG TPA: iron-sulfur cluster assembly accessory protein, partial [Chthonomonadales bacterium]|nr:iron-sulfur cluster assembly accessory protein [Chthonomonadales bacterium]
QKVSADEISAEPGALPLTITPAARRRIEELKQKQGAPNLALKVGVKGGGCSGFSYVLTLAEGPTPRDLVFDLEGLTVLIDRRSVPYLNGVTLDYSLANLLEGGWKFTNPNAAKTCGCGSSFTPL